MLHSVTQISSIDVPQNRFLANATVIFEPPFIAVYHNFVLILCYFVLTFPSFVLHSVTPISSIDLPQNRFSANATVIFEPPYMAVRHNFVLILCYFVLPFPSFVLACRTRADGRSASQNCGTRLRSFNNSGRSCIKHGQAAPCKALICKTILSVKITGLLSVKTLICKKSYL